LDVNETKEGKTMSNQIKNFRVALQASDWGGNPRVGEPSYPGEPRYTSWANDESVWSEWATDSDRYDPDAIRIHLEIAGQGGLPDKDFRFVIQSSDHCGGQAMGTKQFTPWASEGGGWSALSMDADAYDPDAFRIKIQTREWTSPRKIHDMRLGIQLFDHGGREAGDVIAFTPWQSQGGGWSDWAVDRDSYDPDGFKVKLEVRFV
jgi:hypothetical protein